MYYSKPLDPITNDYPSGNYDYPLRRRLQEKYVEVAKSVYLQTLSASAASSGGAGSTQKTHSMISEEITTLWKNANLFEKSITLLDGTRHLSIVDIIELLMPTFHCEFMSFYCLYRLILLI